MHKLLTCLLVPLFVSALSTVAIADVGKVIIAKGETYAEDANSSTRTLKRRSEILEGDTIFTGPNSEVHIRFNDNAVLALRADSQLKISQYHSASGGQEEKVLMELLSGGFRTITGAFGKSDRDAYQIKTAAASIGIRGTNYEAILSEGALLVGVYQGGISITNSAGSINLGLDSAFSYARVDGPNAQSKGLIDPPQELSEPLATSLNATPENKERADQDDESQSLQNDDAVVENQPLVEQNQETQVALNSDPETITDNLASLAASNDSATNDINQLTAQIDLDKYVDLRLTQDQIKQLSTNPAVGFVVVNDNLPGYKLANYSLTTDMSLLDPSLNNPLNGTVSFDISFDGQSYTIKIDNAQITSAYDLALAIEGAIASSNSAATLSQIQISATSPNTLEIIAVSAAAGEQIIFENFTSTATDPNLALSDTHTVAAAIGLCNNTAADCSGFYVNGGPSIGSVDSATHFGYVVDGNNGPVFINYETDSINILSGDYVTPDNVFIGPESTPAQEFTAIDQNNDGIAEVEWGYWNASATAPAVLYKNPEDLSTAEIIESPYFYVSAQPANQADLMGTKSFKTLVDWHGTTTSTGLIDSTTAYMETTLVVDFGSTEATGDIYLANDIEGSAWAWTMNYTGHVNGAQMFSDIGIGSMTDTSGTTSDAVGQVNGLFYDANSSVGFVGGFNMQTTGEEITNSAEGVFVLDETP